MSRSLEISATGPQALLQDLGRPGHAATGVGRSGAADRAALRLGNRLVANDSEGAAAIEVLFGGLVATSRAELEIALTGAPAPATVDGRRVGHDCLVRLRAGQQLRLNTPSTGLRTYVCARGGFTVPMVLGSRSSDTLSGIGPEALVPGTILPIGPEPARLPVIDFAPIAPVPGGEVILRAQRGPHTEHALDADGLARSSWTASSRTDRVGMRLEGRRLDVRDGAGSLPSEGLVRGAIQLPPGGEPVIFLADHPVTGGYPVIAVLHDSDIDRAAQIRPGQRVKIQMTN